jgi:DNA-binding NtrC family response regulator
MANVLVVDDEEVYRTYLSGWLTRDGHEVQIASNGQEAIEIGKEFPPDVLIVDWMLKNEYYGLQVAEALCGVVPDLKTILITGFPSESLRREALNARVFRFIEKPFHMTDLAAAVRDAVASKQA